MAPEGLAARLDAASGSVSVTTFSGSTGSLRRSCSSSARYWWLVPLAVPALSALLALFIAAPCAAAKLAQPGWRRVAMFGGAWVLADLARQYVGTGFPWNPLGSVWTIPGVAGDIMIQPAAMIGTPGLTLATVLLAATPSLGLRAVAGGAAVLLLWVGSGWYRLHQAAPRPTGLQAVLVQGNVTQGQKWDRQAMLEAFDRQLALTREGVARAGEEPTVVIWPETSVAFLLQYDEAARKAVMDAAKPAVAALVGGLTFDAPPSRGTLDTNPPYNSLLALTPNAEIAGIYSKWHLVPFGEFAPSWVPFSIQVVPGRFRLRLGAADAACPRHSGVRPADLLRGGLPGPGDRRGRSPGLDGQHHQRRMVRQFHRTAAAPCRGEIASGRGGAAAAPRR